MADGPSKDELVEIFKSLKSTQKGNKVHLALIARYMPPRSMITDPSLPLL